MDLILTPSSLILLSTTLAVTLAFTLYGSSTRPRIFKEFPTAGLDEKDGPWKISEAKKRWYEHGTSIIEEGLKKFTGNFQVITATGPKIVLRGKYADEIRNNVNLDFGHTTATDFHASIPGFEPFRIGIENEIIVNIVRGRLTQSLNFITEELARETSKTLDELLGQPADWKEVKYKPMLLQLVARVSSRVFVGPELCRKQEWLDVSVDYATQSFFAAAVLHTWSPFLRPIVHHFLPECRQVRKTVSRAREILVPVIQQRRLPNNATRANGEKDSKVANTIGWMDDVAQGKEYDVASAQLSLSLAAIHTTSELMSGIISDLCTHPEWIAPLREEVTTTIAEHGWTKKALQEMKLMDSLMKESQRHHFGDVASMHRCAIDTITLSDGVKIPKGSRTMVALENMNDPSVFKDSAEFNPRRFLEMRKLRGQENKWHFVTTSPEHLSFGHGKHSCPGRFFAANETKVILAYLLTRFEWKPAEGGIKRDVFTGIEIAADPDATVLLKTQSQDILI